MSARQQKEFFKNKCLQRHNCSQAGRGEGHAPPCSSRPFRVLIPVRATGAAGIRAACLTSASGAGGRGYESGKLCCANEEIQACQGPGPAINRIPSLPQKSPNALYSPALALGSSFQPVPDLQHPRAWVLQGR